MNDDTDKLAARMQNLKPSKTSRKAGLEAAMAAFTSEFSGETILAAEKKSTSAQGSADAPRPTGKPTTSVRVKTRRGETMNKFTSIFQKPQAMMMAGTCGAALIAALVVLPNMEELAGDLPVPKGVVSTEEVVAPEIASSASKDIRQEITIEAGAESKSNRERSGEADVVDMTTAEDIGELSDLSLAESSEATPSVETKLDPLGEIATVDDLLSDMQSTSVSTEQERLIKEYRRVLEQKDNFDLFLAQQNAIASAPPSPLIKSTEGVMPSFSGENQIVVSGNKVRSNKGRTRIVMPGNKASSNSPSETHNGLTFEEVPAEYKVETKEIVTKEATTELVTSPATFENVIETVIVQPASREIEVVPPEYEWVEGEIEGSVVEYVATPPIYETVAETVVVQEASTELVTIPPTFNSDGTVKTAGRTVERAIPSVTKTQTRRVVKSPAATIERVVPYETRDGKTRIPIKPSEVKEKIIPPVTKQVSRRVIKTPASTIERIVPAGAKREVEVRTEISPQKFFLRDEDGNIVREFDSRDAFEKYKLNTTIAVSEKPVSTFSVDVDTASYSFLRSSINRGQLPPRSAIRLEEMINYFPYDYEAPKTADKPFKANVTVTSNPWNADTKLMHVGIKGYVPPVKERPSSNIVLLIDTSGSMNRANKLPLLINSFKLLLKTLSEDDTVSIVTYAGRAGTVLEPTPASKNSEIIAALDRLRSGGSTAGAAGLELAYQKAMESFKEDGNNRVILATDGDFNVGFSSPDEMKDYIEEKRETGIFLSVLGFGMGNYNDHLMQSLAQNGNGVAAYIDSLSEANKVLANEAGSSLLTIAKDVKIQVEFNPATIAEYRLLGYETRALKRQDFNNDKVDAGDIGAGHSVTAIYEMTPVGSPAITMDKLRYVSDEAPRNTGSDEYAFVKIRHKLPDADTSTLQTFPIGKRQEKSLRRASNDMRFATAVAIVGQKLRGDLQVEDYSYADAIKLANGAKGKDENGYRAEFVQMVKLIETMEE